MLGLSCVNPIMARWFSFGRISFAVATEEVVEVAAVAQKHNSVSW